MHRIALNIELWLPLATAHGFIRRQIRLLWDTLYLVYDNLLLCVVLHVVIVVVVVFSLQLQLRLQCQPNSAYARVGRMTSLH